MEIYLAATAPGNEIREQDLVLNIKNRLLSFYFILNKAMDQHKVFRKIKHANK